MRQATLLRAIHGVEMNPARNALHRDGVFDLDVRGESRLGLAVIPRFEMRFDFEGGGDSAAIPVS